MVKRQLKKATNIMRRNDTMSQKTYKSILIIVSVIIILIFIYNTILQIGIIEYRIQSGKYLPIYLTNTDMQHNNNYAEWWSVKEDIYMKANISKDRFSKFKFINGINNKSVIMISFCSDCLNIGSVILYKSDDNLHISRLIDFNEVNNETIMILIPDNPNLNEISYIPLRYYAGKVLNTETIIGKTYLSFRKIRITESKDITYKTS
jgi:hypothetical protein